MKKLIDIFHQTLIASTGMLLLLGIEGFIYFLMGKGEHFTLSWYQPFAILFTGFLCSLAIRILPFDKEMGKGAWMVRLAAHFLLNLSIVLFVGCLAKWYDDKNSFFITVSFYIIIYALVWAGMLWFAKYEERLINRALEKMHDRE